MNSHSLFARIELLEKEIAALTKVQAKSYFDVVVHQSQKASDYDTNNVKLEEMKCDLAAAKQIAKTAA